MDSIIRVYDRRMKKVAYLDNAYDINYNLTLNELWTAGFTLPANDKKNEYCQPFYYVEIFDGRRRIELFRIMPSVLRRNIHGDIIYECEHVLATLLDDVMFKYHQIGNLGVYTPQVLRYIIDQQITKRWMVGSCDFNRQFEYKWENENLLAALFSVPKPFNEDYKWEVDTTGSVWRINLKKLNKSPVVDITYSKNMPEIEKTVDPTSIVTRLYCLGYGEGDNQLGIESVNNGKPYLEANGATTTWGLKQSILVDRRFENAETLKAYGQSLLDDLSQPYKSYRVKAVDLHRAKPGVYSPFMPGDVVRIIDKEDNIIEDLPIVGVRKNDISGDPGGIEIEVGNKSRDIAGSISDLQERARINETYAQGATNQIIIPYADNADRNYPAIIRVYIPDTMVRINKLVLNYQLEPFRAYSKAIEGERGSSQTSSSRGGITTTTEAGGDWYDTTMSDVMRTTDTGPGGIEVEWIDAKTGPAGADNHRHLFKRVHAHKHEVTFEPHNHKVEIDPHVHRFTLRDHTHEVDIPPHSHDIEFGIHQGTRANEVTIKVDGINVVGGYSEGDDINLVDYLAVDDSGRIRRNTWHTIEIAPDRMSRIVANVFMQIFTNSRGGGDY